MKRRTLLKSLLFISTVPLANVLTKIPTQTVDICDSVGNPDYLEWLLKMIDAGLPVPKSSLANAAGIPLNNTNLGT